MIGQTSARACIFALRAVAAIAAAAVMAAIVGRAVSPGGRLLLATDLVQPAASVGDPKPNERVALPEQGEQGRMAMTGTPVFVDVFPPSVFDEAAVTASFANDGQPLVLVGALVSPISGEYDMRPLQSSLIDGLPWKRVSSGRVSLFARNGGYPSVDAFLSDPPDPSKVATLGAVPSLPYRTDAPPAHERAYAVSLRGHHRFIAYVRGGALSLSLSVQDMNRQVGADAVSVFVHRLGDQGAPVFSSALADDGDANDDQRSVGLRTVTVAARGLAEGAYQIDFAASDDVFIRSFATDASRFVAADRVYLGDFIGYSDRVTAARLFANGEQLTVRTSHPDSLQTLSVGGEEVPVADANTDSTLALGRGTVLVVVPKRDVILRTNGVFAFSSEDMMLPLPLDIGWQTGVRTLDERGVDFILADYETPSSGGGDATSTVTFDLATLARTKEGGYRFAVDVPGMVALPAGLRIASLRFELRRRATGLAGVRSFFAGFLHPARAALAPRRSTTYDDAVD